MACKPTQSREHKNSYLYIALSTVLTTGPGGPWGPSPPFRPAEP